MKKLTTYFEKTIIISLTVLMGIIVAASTVELAYVIFIDFTKPHDNNVLT